MTKHRTETLTQMRHNQNNYKTKHTQHIDTTLTTQIHRHTQNGPHKRNTTNTHSQITPEQNAKPKKQNKKQNKKQKQQNMGNTTHTGRHTQPQHTNANNKHTSKGNNTHRETIMAENTQWVDKHKHETHQCISIDRHQDATET